MEKDLKSILPPNNVNCDIEGEEVCSVVRWSMHMYLNSWIDILLRETSWGSSCSERLAGVAAAPRDLLQSL